MLSLNIAPRLELRIFVYVLLNLNITPYFIHPYCVALTDPMSLECSPVPQFFLMQLFLRNGGRTSIGDGALQNWPGPSSVSLQYRHLLENRPKCKEKYWLTLNKIIKTKSSLGSTRYVFVKIISYSHMNRIRTIVMSINMGS